MKDNFYLNRIQRGIEFIEARLDDQIPLGEVAREAGISQWHFQRMFKALTGDTLKRYIRSRRLALSLQRLMTTDLRVLDIALLAGFESQDAFARAFRKAFDMSPQDFRRIGHRHRFVRKPTFDETYLRHINQNVSFEPEIVEWPRLRLVGLRTLFYGVDSEKNNIGQQLPPLWDQFLARRLEIPTQKNPCYGVIRPTPEDDERLEYHAAVGVDQDVLPPPGMVSVEIPRATYAVFTHCGPVQQMDHTVNYIYSTWLVGSGYRHTYGCDLEIYGDQYHPTRGDSVIHYAIPCSPPT